MVLTIKIETKSASKMLSELADIRTILKDELSSPICRGCKSCKDPEKGCFVGGGSSEPGLESNWELRRKYPEHQKICKSKQRK